MTERDNWLDKLTMPLTPEQVRRRISDDNPHWAFIDGEMVKLGALSHGTLNLREVQQRILLLLATESKDFRLVVHLLRTLQHAGQPQDVILALQLLCGWVKAYWNDAWPANAMMKRRLAQQVMKRFSAAANIFIALADEEQRQQALGDVAHLAQLWQAQEKELAMEADALSALLRRPPQRREPEPSQPEGERVQQGGVETAPAIAAAPTLELDTTSDKAWRQTQLRMAQILCERHPDNPLGYRMRRNAVWQGIVSAPMAQADGRTPLAGFSADRMAEYASAATHPDPALWEQVEQSLELAPYWFDGHRLSAAIAQALGYVRVAEAICEELQLFLQRLPLLANLSFTDRTPFLSQDTQDWLAASQAAALPAAPVQSAQAVLDQGAVWQCWQQQGMEAALGMIDAAAAAQNPRGQFYCRLLWTRLLEEAGMTALAQQGYRHLYLVASGVTLADWEPELIVQLRDKHLSSEG